MKKLICVIFMLISLRATAVENWHSVSDNVENGHRISQGKFCFAGYAHLGDSSIEIITEHGANIFFTFQGVGTTLNTTRIHAGYYDDFHHYKTWYVQPEYHPFYNRSFVCIKWLDDYISFYFNQEPMFRIKTPPALQNTEGFLKVNGVFVTKARHFVLIDSD